MRGIGIIWWVVGLVFMGLGYQFHEQFLVAVGIIEASTGAAIMAAVEVLREWRKHLGH